MYNTPPSQPLPPNNYPPQGIYPSNMQHSGQHIPDGQYDSQLNNEEKPSVFSRVITIVLECLAALLLLFYLLRIFVFQQFTVSGTSMLPTVKDGQLLIVNTWSYKWATPSRGDIVVLIPPQSTQEYYVKRVIGLSEETIEIDYSYEGDNQVLIFNDTYPNGITLREEYLAENQETFGTLREKIEEGNYFVLGDNRKLSSDSRGNTNDIKSAWQLPQRNVVGKALFILEPDKPMLQIGPFSLPRLTFIHDPEYNL